MKLRIDLNGPRIAWHPELKISLNEAKILGKVTNDRFGLFVSNEWKRLIDPYTPYDTGTLMGVTGTTVDLYPFKIHYKTKYSSYVYYNLRGVTYRKKISPYASQEWDKAAEQAGQKDKLYRTLNDALRSGRF